MNKLKLIGSNTFEGGKQKKFIVYYYIQINEAAETYGIRLEKKYQDPEREFEYAEESGVTESSVLAEEMAHFLIDYEVTPISLPESLDAFLNKKE